MGHAHVGVTDRVYKHLFDRQSTEDAFRKAMGVRKSGAPMCDAVSPRRTLRARTWRRNAGCCSQNRRFCSHTPDLVFPLVNENPV